MKRAPRKSAGTTSKANHLLWIDSEGLPDLQRRLHEEKQNLDNVSQEITDLDMQMRAIKAMKTKEEFKIACETHVEVKLQMSIRLSLIHI